VNAPQRYAGLRTIAVILQVLAWVVLVLGVVGFLWLLLSGPSWPGLRVGNRNLTGLLFLPFVLTAFFQWFILGSVLKLLTDLEQNTRLNSMGLERLIAMSQEANRPAAASQPVARVTPPPLSPETIPPPLRGQTEVKTPTAEISS
jgi:hypothetical protein